MICVNSVSVSPKSITLKVGEWFYNTNAEVSPSDADCKQVFWHSNNTSVASVNASSGYICANAVGTAKIYASATDGSGCKDYLTVTVSDTVPVESVTLSSSFLSIQEGQRACLSATVLPENATNKALIWTAPGSNIVSVNDGVVTALTKGSGVITATAADGSGKSASCIVSVNGAVLVSSIVVPPLGASLTVGDSAFLSATVIPSNATNKTVLWSSSDPTVATVNEVSGLVMAQSAGTATIYATAADNSGVVGSCNVTVNAPVLVEDITLSETRLELRKGGNRRLLATVCPVNATNKTLLWHSSKPSVATVDQRNGRVHANAAGSAVIYATAQDGSNVNAFCIVVVKQATECPAEETPVNKAYRGRPSHPVNAYTGAHRLNNTLMSMFGGLGIKLVAHYDSTQLNVGSLGIGWYHNYEKHIEVNGSDAFVYNNPSIFSRYTADSDCCQRFTCRSADKNGYVLTVDHSRQYPYIIDCNSARIEYYNANGDLAKIKDHQGFDTLISYSDRVITITDGVSGKKMYLEKDASCRVVRVYDDANRQASLTYQGCLLTKVCDVNGHKLTYGYDEENRVVSGTDSDGTVYFENTYDEYGRVLSQKDALNHSSHFDYCDDTYDSFEGDTRIATNRNGKNSSRIYNCDGLLIKYTDENGNTTTYEYDDCYNVTKETDAKGNSVIKQYNSFNKPTHVIDRNGNHTYFTYDLRGNVTKIQYPAVDGVVPEESFVYNGRNQMTKHTDIRGTVTLYTYDANGMPATKKIGSKNAIVYSYEAGLLKSQTDALGHTTTYTYNEMGQLASMTDADNKVTEYVYDKSGNLLRTVDAHGKTTVTTYDCNYRRTSFTDPNGNKTEYSYNGNMMNDVITLPDGHTVHYEFDGEDRIVKMTDQENNITDTVYDGAGRVLSKRLPDGALIQYEYDKVGNVIKETNPKGAITRKTYDKIGNVLTATDHAGNVTTYEYNAMSKVTKVVNAVAGATVYVYSEAGDLLSETDALGNTKTYTYDAYGNRLTATDAKGNVTTYTYDQNNNLLTVKDALNHVTTYSYNSLNQCVSVKDALNNVIHYGYDALGRRTTVTDARGNVFTTTYDAAGNVIKTTDARGNTVSETVYNSLNQPLTVTDAMGKTTTYTYNALGKVESVTDPLNHRTEFTYDSRGQNTEVRDAANHVSRATYDVLGNVTRLAGPLGGSTNYTYDDMGRLVTESTVSGGIKSYEYNELNVRKKITNARGLFCQLFYDSMGRITGASSPEGTVSYTYDANGNVLTVMDGHGTVTRTYDALNRVSTYTDTYGKTVGYEYDAVGNLSKIIYPDNTAVTYAYDANHNLIRVTDWANRVTTYTYDENNRVVGVTKPDGSVTTTVYDGKQRVTSTVERTAGGTIITGFEYTYDDLSRIVEEKHLDKNAKFCYTYDSLSRVTSRTVRNLDDDSVVFTETFDYDAAGNVTDAPDSCFAYDVNNRLMVFNGNTVSYDLDGNMLSNGVQSFTYDWKNRLLTAGGHTYTYNAENVRIRNLCEDEDTTYTYDNNAKLNRLLCKTTNGVTTKYVYGRGLIGEENGNAFKTYHFDSRGSTVAITDASGNVTDTFAYDTYGKLTSRTGTSKVIFGYNGRDGVVTDDNGLIYMRTRYYSPEMKRFVNADILAGSISNAITLNRYAYANGNPASFIDPTGMRAVLDPRSKLASAQHHTLDGGSGQAASSPQSSTQAATQERQTQTTSSTSNRDAEKAGALITEKVIEETLDKTIEQSAKQLDRMVQFEDLTALNRTKPSHYIDSVTKIITITETVNTTVDGIVDNYNAGESWGEIGTDAALDVGSTLVPIGVQAGTTWAVAKIGAAVGTTVAPGVGTAIGTVVGFLAGIAYEIWGKPALDSLLE